MKLMMIVLVFFSCATTLNADSLHPPFNEIDILYPFADDRRRLDEDKAFMKQLIDSYEITTVIAVGAFLGKVVIPMAQALPIEGKIYAIDHWLKTPMSADLEFSGFLIDDPWKQFLSNIIHAGQTDKVVPIQTDSLTAALVLNTMADLIYIDPSHDFFPLFTTLSLWYRHLNTRGLLCGNHWNHDAVQRAVLQFSQIHPELTLVHGESCYCLYRPAHLPLYRN